MYPSRFELNIFDDVCWFVEVENAIGIPNGELHLIREHKKLRYSSVLDVQYMSHVFKKMKLIFEHERMVSSTKKEWCDVASGPIKLVRKKSMQLACNIPVFFCLAIVYISKPLQLA